jgi:large conductance mechanosensitive channel
MCIDLMPLVQDGVASEDSRNAVLQHLQECPDCRALYEGEIPTPSNTKEILGKVTRRAQLFSAMVMMFGIFYGLMLTAGNGIFMNVIIMPIIGVLTGGLNFSDWKIVLKQAVLDAEGVVTNPEVAITFGNTISVIIDFIIIAFAVFCMVKGVNALHRKKEEAPAAPPAPPEPSAEEKLLTEIRDLLANK